MPKKGESNQLGIRCSEQMMADLRAIQENNGLQPVDLARRLLESACQFYRRYGFFSWPAHVIPEGFQATYIAEAQATYHTLTKSGRKRKKKNKKLSKEDMLVGVLPLIIHPTTTPAAESLKAESKEPSHSAG